MANPIVMTNVGVSMALFTNFAAAKTITDITLGATTEVAATANGYANGDWVLIGANGIPLVKDRVFRVSGAATDAFDLEGLDTSLLDPVANNFVSGSARKITFATSASVLTNVTFSGGDPSYVDGGTIHTSDAVNILTGYSARQCDIEAHWNMDDSFINAWKTAAQSNVYVAVYFSFQGGQKAVAYGQPTASDSPTGSKGAIIMEKIGLSLSNRLVSYPD